MQTNADMALVEAAGDRDLRPVAKSARDGPGDHEAIDPALLRPGGLPQSAHARGASPMALTQLRTSRRTSGTSGKR